MSRRLLGPPVITPDFSFNDLGQASFEIFLFLLPGQLQENASSLFRAYDPKVLLSQLMSISNLL